LVTKHQRDFLERLVKFEVCGQEYSLNTDAPEDEVQEILALVRSQIEIHSKSGSLLPARLAVLASLNMAGKYIKLKKEFAQYKLIVQEKLATVTGQIEGKL
jgi:cell division protein ZapA